MNIDASGCWLPTEDSWLFRQSTAPVRMPAPAFVYGKQRPAIFLLLALLGLAFFSANAHAITPDRTLQQCLQRIWQVPQGLPQATIFASTQTQDGYLWLGTQTGLVRFDGVHFTTISNAQGESLENIWVTDLCEDSEGYLWIATDGAGLIRLRHGEAKRFMRSDGLPSNVVHCLLSDRNGGVWVGTADGLAKVGKTIKVYRAPQGIANNNIRALCQTPEGALWIGGEGNELSIRKGESLTSLTLKSLAAHGVVQAMLCARDGAIWVGTTNGLVRLKDGEEECFTTSDGLAHDVVLCLTEGREGKALWVGTKEGFSRLQGTPAAGSKEVKPEPEDPGVSVKARPFEIESFRPRDGLSQSTVYTLCEDREGSLWVGTKHGLNQFSDRRTMLYSIREGLPSNDAGPVFQDTAGNLWVGTLGAGLGRFDGRRFSVLTTADGLASNTVYALASGDDGEVWIGTDKGLSRLRRGLADKKNEKPFGKTYTTADGLPSDIVWCLCRDQRGALWAGTSAGLAELRGERFVQPKGDPAALPASIRALVGRRDGSLLAAAEAGGLFRLSDGELHSLTDDSLAHRDVGAFYEDSDGLLWMGTVDSGLLLLDGEQTSSFTTRDGLFDDDIFGIVADDEDRLWMACSKGIFFVSRTELRNFAAGRVKHLTSTPFSPMDSLRTIECKGGVQPAAYKMRDGRVWFSTIRGLIVVDPHHLQRIIPPIPVLVEEVVVNGKNEMPDRVRTLPPGETNLSFRYAALSFVSPTRITFRYMLEGFDKEWVEAGSRREAFYTNLPPGSYRFRVTARTTDGAGNEVANPVAFTLEPYFYQTAWFLPLCGTAAAVVIWAAYRLRVRRIREHLQVVVAERSRIARELHDTLMQGFSGVTMEMQALSVRLPPSEERNTLEEIIGDAGVCLRDARRSVAGLRSAPHDESGLAGAIAEAAKQITETQDIRLKLKLQGAAQSLPTDVQYNLLRIVQEAVTNAVKHSSGGAIEVVLDSTPESLHLSVKDDGVGFNLEQGNGSLPGHYGLIGMRERANQIGADLHLESGPGLGTTVSIRLPLPHAGNHLAAKDRLRSIQAESIEPV